MKRIAVIPNTAKKGAEDLARTIVREFPEDCYILDDNNKEFPEAAVVLGGDGTMLRAVKRCCGAPLLGINFGTIGYMAAVEKEDALSSVKKVIDGDYSVEERMMLDISVIRSGSEISRTLVLNDGVITRKEHMLSLSEYFNDSLVYSFFGDGIIIATPTGSTAYSLSAGGPVAPPDMQTIISTPVCPHSIHIRPVIASPDTVVRLKMGKRNGSEAFLNADGQNICTLYPGDEIVFKMSEQTARLICLEKKNFYDILRYKLSGNKGEKNESD